MIKLTDTVYFRNASLSIKMHIIVEYVLSYISSVEMKKKYLSSFNNYC